MVQHRLLSGLTDGGDGNEIRSIYSDLIVNKGGIFWFYPDLPLVED